MENKDIQTKQDLIKFLTHWVDHSTCSQGKGKLESLPTGGCGDPHYISRDQLFELLDRVSRSELTQHELDKGEDF